MLVYFSATGLKGKSRLTDSARAGDRHEIDPTQQCRDLGQILVASDEALKATWQIGAFSGR